MSKKKTVEYQVEYQSEITKTVWFPDPVSYLPTLMAAKGRVKFNKKFSIHGHNKQRILKITTEVVQTYRKPNPKPKATDEK